VNKKEKKGFVVPKEEAVFWLDAYGRWHSKKSWPRGPGLGLPLSKIPAVYGKRGCFSASWTSLK
jgi:hypothetical protein